MSPRHVVDAAESGPTAWEGDEPQSWTGGRWVREAPAGADVGEALRVLQAIGILQRWVSQRPLGADTLCLTSTSIALSDGGQVVSVITNAAV
jgi:hypothetical protein